MHTRLLTRLKHYWRRVKPPAIAPPVQQLRSVQYENINPTPTVGTLRVRFQVDDGSDTSAWDRRTIEIINDDPPRASDDSDTVSEGGSVIIDLAGNPGDKAIRIMINQFVMILRRLIAIDSAPRIAVFGS